METIILIFWYAIASVVLLGGGVLIGWYLVPQGDKEYKEDLLKEMETLREKETDIDEILKAIDDIKGPINYVHASSGESWYQKQLDESREKLLNHDEQFNRSYSDRNFPTAVTDVIKARERQTELKSVPERSYYLLSDPIWKDGNMALIEGNTYVYMKNKFEPVSKAIPEIPKDMYDKLLGCRFENAKRDNGLFVNDVYFGEEPVTITIVRNGDLNSFQMTGPTLCQILSGYFDDMSEMLSGGW